MHRTILPDWDVCLRCPALLMSCWQGWVDKEKKKIWLLQQREDIAKEVDARACGCVVLTSVRIWRRQLGACDKCPRALVIRQQIALL